jgi:hypothetical protein
MSIQPPPLKNNMFSSTDILNSVWTKWFNSIYETGLLDNYNVDGGTPTSIYGGIDPIDGGGI